MLIVAPLGGWGDRVSPLGGSAELRVPWYLQGWVLGPAWPREPFLRISAGCSPVPCVLLLESSVPGGGVALRAVAGSPALQGPSREGVQVLSPVLWGACAVPGALLSGAYYLVPGPAPEDGDLSSLDEGAPGCPVVWAGLHHDWRSWGLDQQSVCSHMRTHCFNTRDRRDPG